MKAFTEMSWPIFNQAIADYHKTDNVDTPINNPYPVKSIEYYLYLKCWIDTVQWHFEDIIRDPNIDPVEALTLKRRIDKSNQDRTDLVELIDSYFLDLYKDMNEEVIRTDVSEEHRTKCQAKLDVLTEQYKDMTTSIGQLLDDIAAGRKYMKVYRQMKMYNDPSLNPVLYGAEKK